MIIRIVKMTFETAKVADFLALFNATKEKIRHFEGCKHLELLNDINSPNCYFTYSHWESEEHLNNYRDSALFASVWKETKVLFAAKAEAWSVIKADG
jgi:quinol monooxygenase YgiN